MSNSLKLVSAPVRESRLWDIPGYVPWFTADSATAIGVALRYLAVSLIGYKLTGSTTAAGWLGSLAAIAQQAAAVFGGTFADRHDRKTLIIVNATAGVICWGSVAALLMAGKLVFPVLLAIAVFESAVNGFLGPASDAMLKSIVDIRSYPKARSLNEGRDATINGRQPSRRPAVRHRPVVAVPVGCGHVPAGRRGCDTYPSRRKSAERQR